MSAVVVPFSFNSMRAINPFRRFVSFPVYIGGGAGGFAFGQNIHQFKFEQDSILHTVNMQSQFSTAVGAAPTQLLMGVSFSTLEGLSIEEQGNCILLAQVTNGDQAGASASKYIVPFNDRVQFENMSVRSGSTLYVGVQALAGAGWDVSGNVSISFSTLSEWVNFREPGSAVRL